MRTIRVWLFAIMVLLFFLNICGGLVELLLEGYQNDAERSSEVMERGVDILFSSMIDQETGLRGYITTLDPVFLQPFYQGREVYLATLPYLARNLQHERFINAKTAFTVFNLSTGKWYSSFALIQLRLIHDKNYVKVRSIQNAKQGKALFDAFRITARHLKNSVSEDTDALRHMTNVLETGTMVSMIIVTLLFLMFIYVVAQRIFNDIGRQLKVLLATMATYNQGDYHVRMPAMKHEEFQFFTAGFNDVMAIIEQQQHELRQSELHFRLLADTLPQIVWTAKPDGQLDYYSRRWFEYTGMTLEQTYGWGWKPVLHPDDLQHCMDVWTHSFTTGESYQIECRLRRASDGAYRWHLGRALPLRDATGKIIRWFGTATDIEDLKHVEEMLVQAVQDQHDFVSTISHEFRSALTSIQGFSELLCAGDFEMDQVKDYASDIHADALRLKRMINDLLDLEKMQSGRSILEEEEVNFNEIASEVVGRMNTISSEHHIDFRYDKSEHSIYGDRDKLTQIMYNLLSNSIKYSPHSGYIVVEMSKEETQIHVCIKDQGIGIPKEALEAIFHPYNRVHTESTRYIQGTGLGLPIVRHLVELHGGQIWAESVIGQGSTFHFTLPIKRPGLLVDETAIPVPTSSSVRSNQMGNKKQ